MRFVIDGTTVSAVGGKRGATVVQVSTPKGYRRRPAARTTTLGTTTRGMQARQLRAGSLVGGQRVTGLRTGIGWIGRQSYPTVAAQLADGSWTQPMFLNQIVPGTEPRTDLPAGPTKGGGFCVKDRLIRPRRAGETVEEHHMRVLGGRAVQFKEAN